MDRIVVGLLAFVMWNAFVDLASTSIINSPVDTEVMVGHSTYLNCSTSDPSTEIHWYHYPVVAGIGDHEYVYVYGRMHPPFDKRFRIDKDNSTTSFNLVLTNVEFPDAGLYVCQNGGGTGQLISAQLIVLDTFPSCETNIKSEGFVGPNSCDLETEKVQLSCGVSYHGNIPPALEWTRVGRKIRASNSEPLCKVSDTRITCNVTLDTDINMDGSSFLCQTTRAVQEQYQCATEKAKVLYAVGDKQPLEKTIGDEVTCSAKSNSPSCSYNWIWFDGVTENIISNDQNLKVKEQGWHRCEANCNIKENPCTFVPMLVKGSADPVPATVNNQPIGILIAVIMILVLCLLIFGICGYFVWKKLTGHTATVNLLKEQIESQTHKEQIKGSLTQPQTVITKLLPDTPVNLLKEQLHYQSPRKKMMGSLKQFEGVFAETRPTTQLNLLKEQLHYQSPRKKMMGSLKQFEGVFAETRPGTPGSKSTAKKEKGRASRSLSENASFIYDYNNEIRGQDRMTDNLCETHNVTSNTHDSLVFKPKGLNRIGQHSSLPLHLQWSADSR